MERSGVVIRQDPNRGVDLYGRFLVLVERNGEDLGKALIARGLARPWEGKRKLWC